MRSRVPAQPNMDLGFALRLGNVNVRTNRLISINYQTCAEKSSEWCKKIFILGYPGISHNFLEWHPSVPNTDQIDIFWLEDKLEKIEDSEESLLIVTQTSDVVWWAGSVQKYPQISRSLSSPRGSVWPRCHTFVLLLAFLLVLSPSLSLSTADNCKNWLHISCFHYARVKSCCPELNRGQW